MRLTHGTLGTLARRLLCGGGAPAEEARIVADHLVDANLRGHDSHGIGMLPLYTWHMRRGSLHPDRHLAVRSDRAAVITADGQAGFGQVVGAEVTRLGIERAREHGVAVTALGNSFHLGRIGAYAELCAEAGLISMHFVNVVGHPPQVAPHGGARPVLNTNPFCCAVPTADGAPLVLDMATSTVALGKVRVAAARGEVMPPGCLVDERGRPTTDPFVMPIRTPDMHGALTPFGGHKGSGLGLVCELLGGALAGGWTVIRPLSGDSITNNMLSVVLDPGALGDRGAFEADVRAMIEHVRASPPAEGVPAVLVAGDPERLAMKARLRDGIEIAPGTWKDLTRIAPRLGIEPEELEQLLRDAPP